MKGFVHSFESLAALDGEGVRFGIFMSGCPLRCVYCHNPDTWCGSAVEYTPEEIVKKAVRYKPYFGDSGGVTFSGGEPLLQSDFIKETVSLLCENEIRYVIDTSGVVPLTESVKYVLKNAQLVILDLKFYDSVGYKKYTGQDIDKTAEMLKYLEKENIRVWVRTVVVPYVNDSTEEINKYAEFVKGYRCIEKYELLPFHRMGFEKYEKLGIENPLINTPSMDKEKCVKLQNYIDRLIKEQ